MTKQYRLADAASVKFWRQKAPHYFNPLWQDHHCFIAEILALLDIE